MKDCGILIFFTLIILSMFYLYRMPGVCEFDPVLNKLIKDAIKIEPKSTNLEFFPSDESYTEDKQRVFLCLKDRNDKYYDYNHLIQVLVHELAHAFSPIYDKDHTTPEFNNLHNKYRSIAIDNNLLNANDRVPDDYCKK